MKRSLSAPCLAEDENDGSKKVREDKLQEPTGREYLQLALARVLELQRQVKDDTYTTDNTSDLGESDSEEDVMKEVLIKVFKDLPGSSPAVTSIINQATRPQHPQIRVIRDKRIQLSGYDTCRKVALEFMNTVVQNTPINERDLERFEMGMFSKTQVRMANHKTGLIDNRGGQSSGENSRTNANLEHPNADRTRSMFRNNLRNDGGKNEKSSQFSRCRFSNPSRAQDNANNVNRGMVRNFEGGTNHRNYFQRVQNQGRNSVNCVEFGREPVVSRDYEIRVRMLKGLDLHLASKQRDFTARLMRQ